MRSMWSGSISFGLVNIPIRMYNAVSEQNVHFTLLHNSDMSPIRYAKVCRLDSQELTKADIVRGYEYQDGEYVVVTEEDMEAASPKLSRSIEIMDFVDDKEIESIFYERPYYLEPDKGASRAYGLLREALNRSGKVGIGRYVIRDKEHMAAIRPVGRAIILNQLRFAAEIRSWEGLNLPEETAADEREMDLAMALVDKMTESFRPDAYKDTYTEALRKTIQEKIEGKETLPREETPQPTNVVDLMAVLRKSLEAERKEAA